MKRPKFAKSTPASANERVAAGCDTTVLTETLGRAGFDFDELVATTLNQKLLGL